MTATQPTYNLSGLFISHNTDLAQLDPVFAVHLDTVLITQWLSKTVFFLKSPLFFYRVLMRYVIFKQIISSIKDNI